MSTRLVMTPPRGNAKEPMLQDMREPTRYYPFSIDDDVRSIIPFVLRGLISYVTSKGVTGRSILTGAHISDDLLQKIHPHMKEIGTRHRRALKEKISRIILDLCKKNEALDKILAQKNKDMPNTLTLQKLQNICNRIISKYETQTTFD